MRPAPVIRASTNAAQDELSIRGHNSCIGRMYKMQFSHTASICLRAVCFGSPTRNRFEIFLRARRALEFLHSQDPLQT
jgi:hypothetical protein